tara:strand:- start:97 stop:963 length:867 start_codon:yes stop_codon:yes gene_type:complete
LLKILKTIFTNHNVNKKEIYLVDPFRDKEFLIDSIEEEKILGIDTEFDWRNTYLPKLSLLQIATQKKILLIDCLKCETANYLKEILEDKKKLIIFHSSRSDTTVLFANLNIKIDNIFDIQIAEKNISGGDIQNYAGLVKKYFYINLKKTETNSNWLKRPFSNEQLSYAADDVNFLLEIYKKQLKILKKYNLYNKSIDESRRESRLGSQDLHVSRLKKLRKSSKLEKSIFLWREKYAKKLNIPTSYIFKNKDLKKLTLLFNSQEIDQNKISDFLKKNIYAEDLIEHLKN